MKLSLFKVVVLLSLILTTTSYAQEQGLIFNFFGGGARSEGMGQAYLAISNDAFAGSWNPAGLYIHEKTLMGFSYGFFMPRGKYEFFGSPEGTYNHTGTYSNINNLGIISPMRIKNHHFVMSLSYNRNFDVYYKFGDILSHWTTSGPNTFYDRHGGLNAISLAFGTRLSGQLSFGVAGNIYDGKVVTDEQRSLFWNDSLSNVEVLDSTGYSGFNATVGLLYTGEKLRGALVLKTPFNLRGNSDSTTYKITTFNSVTIANKTDTVYVNGMTSKLAMPWMIGLGSAYNVNDNMVVSADMEFRSFSGKLISNLRPVKGIELTASGDRIEHFNETDPNWSNVIQFRLGAEYLLHPPIGEIPIRVGFRNEAFPYGEITGYTVKYEGAKGSNINDSSRISYIFTYNNSKVTGYSLALGTGIHWSQVILDVAYTFSAYKQDILQDSELHAENKWRNHHLNLTFTGYF
ncbi:exported hypothetical protein [Candidatus Zixiibacteriota bacterium]|nr:exported hypothetical protein [candidate division Zixibacteria bacterium]